jgi:ABC-2 type transport system permease protein
MLVCFLTIAPVGFTITGTDAVWVTVLSYFPLFTGPMMMARLATGNAYWWEGLISIGLLVASIVVLSWLGARVYRVGVLMYGSKPTFKRFFKLLFGGQ